MWRPNKPQILLDTAQRVGHQGQAQQGLLLNLLRPFQCLLGAFPVAPSKRVALCMYRLEFPALSKLDHAVAVSHTDPSKLTFKNMRSALLHNTDLLCSVQTSEHIVGEKIPPIGCLLLVQPAPCRVLRCR